MLFFGWSFMAHDVDRSTLETDAAIRVTDHDTYLEFAPQNDRKSANLLFLPGGMVQVKAYAPMARAIAEAGFRVVILKWPFLSRHAPTDGHKAEALRRAAEVMRVDGSTGPWVVAGHSFGGAMASRLAEQNPGLMESLVLIGTTHPRDIDLSSTGLQVMKILGSRDRIASPAKARANAPNLPEDARWVEIDGANHEQFAYYGPHLGGGRASISRAEQQDTLMALLVEELERVLAEFASDVRTAEAFVDAFYSFDPDRLGALLASADESGARTLAYQAWAEGGHYAIIERAPCEEIQATEVRCSITVRDDMIAALDLGWWVTDHFDLTFEGSKIASVATSSNDPQVYHDARAWVLENRPGLVEEPCEELTGTRVRRTPGLCAAAMRQGYLDFAQSEDFPDELPAAPER